MHTPQRHHHDKRVVDEALWALGCPACADLVAGGAAVRKLNDASPMAQPGTAVTVITSRVDEIVTPPAASFVDETGVNNIYVQDCCGFDPVSHVGEADDLNVRNLVLNSLEKPVYLGCLSLATNLVTRRQQPASLYSNKPASHDHLPGSPNLLLELSHLRSPSSGVLLIIFPRPRSSQSLQCHQVSEKAANSKSSFVAYKGVNLFIARRGSRNMQASKNIAVLYFPVVIVNLHRVSAALNR
ncbi:uncharacterized protein MAM_08269 [Metarhizium album ARSEF 1941]|uniref:Uncharacterized protein n=1 Tax=Metarhizium album (strain ARSEF 1941) TaxID=1081103 RepID=A0A0B2WK53_METAS|nr:uncharacterized protein MAM_08269 [Metarhizium album ARSEF 1941]KHN93847.1 hypothetical protein MAM_08269 [Metarhizium album ARSEF 1941]